MLRLFTARENIDKERFVYENIVDECFVLVPNQYTLVAEEQAMNYMSSECLFDVEILSMNRLGLRILTEQGLESVKMLDRNGRFMLLSRIIKQHKSELNIYSQSAGKISFTMMLNSFIADYKQQNCTLEDIKRMLSEEDADELLIAKLSELQIIIEEYERSMAGRYLDSEDYVARYVEAIKDSRLLDGKNIWIYGYDTITPKFKRAIFELSKKASSVNFIVNESDFGLDRSLVESLYAGAAEEGIDISCEHIGRDYEVSRSETIRRIERGLFNDQLPEDERSDNARFVPAELKLVRASNPYSEAETAAAYVYHLVRDCGYMMKDIQLIANNEEILHPIIKRCFEEYGLPIFQDSSRSITSTTAVSFIVNMLLFIRYKDGTKFLLAMLKTGLAEVNRDRIEALENYARRYKIKGSMWKSSFKYGREELGDEAFDMIEELRSTVVEALMELEALAGSGTVEAFVVAFKDYLEKRWCLSTRLDKNVQQQLEMNCPDQAQMDVQSYIKSLELLDQMVEIMGDEPLDVDEFIDLYINGLASLEVGVIPPNADGLSVGTMIRTRPRPSKAVLVIGANEGVLPMQASPEGLFSIDEKRFLKDRDFALGSLDDLQMAEENVAMYRILSKPSQKLYVSYSMTDTDGKDAEPSTIIDSLVGLFPRIKEDDLIDVDIISAGWDASSLTDDKVNDRINAPQESLRYLINHLKDRNTPREMDSQTEALLSWFEANRNDELAAMLKLAQYENVPADLGRKLAAELFARSDGNIVLSASSINSYFSCPFKFFVEKGLRPEEEREFSGDARSIGNVYHECLMVIAQKIMADKAYGKKLAECEQEELEQLIAIELDKIASEGEGGVFVSCGSEEFHLSRMREICACAAQAMARQLATDNVVKVHTEESFGRGHAFKPIELDIGGQKVYVEGKLDRADVMLTDGSTEASRIRIVDYKTGNDKLDIHSMSHGYKMQLMIYMMSALGDYEPAGLFYFNIKDPIESYNDKDETLVGKNGRSLEDRDLADSYKLNGVYVDDPGILEAMPIEALGNAKAKLSREEFEQLRESVSHSIEELAGGIVAGKIAIRPYKENKKLVCNYCQYRFICRRDREYSGNAGRELPARPSKKAKK